MENFWTDRNVFVSGANGFLGPWLIDALLKSGANVVALIRDHIAYSNFIRLELNKKVHIVQGCLTDYFTLQRALNEFEIDSVFHLGAQAIVPTANRSPLSTFESNIKGTWNILEAARNSKLIERVIVASSDKAYGSQKELPYIESMALKGEHPYDVSKSCADLITQSYYKTYGLPVCISRCGNFYGGGDLNFNRIIPGTIKSALFNTAPIIRSDGTYIRDYIYVKDVVHAYLTLAEQMIKQNIKGEAFNFSYDNKLTVLEVVNLILELTNKNLKPVILNNAKGEIKHQYLNSEKAKNLLSWKPLYDIESGLKETIPWYIEFFKNVRKKS